MEYKEASNLRKKGIFGGITQGLVDKKGLGSSISDVFKAKAVGIKEKFDPMNIARMMGGKLGAGIYGKVMGRNQEDMEHFTGLTGKKRKGVGKLGKIELNFINKVGEGKKSKLTSNDGAATVVGKIYNMINKSYQDKKLNLEFEQNFKEEGIEEDERRHEEFLKAIKESKEAKPKVEKPKKPKEEKKKEPTTQAPIKGEPAKAPETGKPAPKASETKPATKAEQAKPVETKPATKAEQAKPVETKPATKADAAKSTKVEPPKEAKPATPAKKIEPPTPSSGVSTAAKIAIGVGASVGLLPLLAKAESGDYNQLVFPYPKSKAPSKAPLTEMNIKEVLAYQSQMAESGNYPSNAVGKYQIIRSTLKGGVEALKIPLSQKFDKTTQDRLYYEYLTGSGPNAKRQNLGKYLDGKVPDTSENLMKAQMDLAMEFASIGVPRKVKASELGKGAPKRDLEVGVSFYSGDGVNKASVSPQQSAKSLQDERTLRTGQTPKSSDITPNIAPSGTKLNDASTENKDLKQTSSPTPVVINNNGTTLVNTNQGKQQLSKPVNTNSPYVNAQVAHG